MSSSALPFDLFERLVDRHGADGYRAVADDPFAGFVDVAAGGQIHHRVAPPADGPGHFLDFFLDARTEGGVADVGVDLDQEVASDDHRLALRVVDVGRDDGPPAGDFAPDELGGDLIGYRGAEALAAVLAAEQLGHLRPGRAGGAQARQIFLPAQVLADRDVFHLRGHQAGPRVVHLAHVAVGQGAAGVALQAGEAQLGGGRVGRPFAAVAAGQCGQRLAVAALGDPLRAQRGQAAADVDLRLWIAVRAGAVVDGDRRVGLAAEGCRGVRLGDLAHRYANVRARALDMDLARVGQGCDGCRIHMRVARDEFLVGVHAFSLRDNVFRGATRRTAGRGRGPVRCASLRRHYPDQVQRDSLTRLHRCRAVCQDPQVSGETLRQSGRAVNPPVPQRHGKFVLK